VKIKRKFRSNIDSIYLPYAYFIWNTYIQSTQFANVLRVGGETRLQKKNREKERKRKNAKRVDWKKENSERTCLDRSVQEYMGLRSPFVFSLPQLDRKLNFNVDRASRTKVATLTRNIDSLYIHCIISEWTRCWN